MRSVRTSSAPVQRQATLDLVGRPLLPNSCGATAHPAGYLAPGGVLRPAGRRAGAAAAWLLWDAAAGWCPVDKNCFRCGRAGVNYSRRSVLSPRVVGRDQELDALGEAVERAAAGQGGVVFLVGEAGIGKSRLAQATATDAQRRQLPVLGGRAVQAPSPVAYRPLAESLCSAVRLGIAPQTPELEPFRQLSADSYRNGVRRGGVPAMIR